MYKYYIIVIAAVLTGNTAMAVTRDSIGVENNKGKKLILHKVVAKDTYYSIGRRYNVNPKEILNFNDSKYLSIGIVIKVPTNVPFIAGPPEKPAPQTPAGTTSTDNTAAATEGELIEHTVQKKENLNLLAERYGTTVNEIKKANNMRSINLQIGQVLKIPATKRPDEALQPEPVAAQTVQKPADTPAAKPVKTGTDNNQNALNKNIDLNKPSGSNAGAEELLVHTVASNETIYSIATKYHMTIDQLKAKNNLDNSGLSVGQKLLIRGQYPAKPAFTPPANTADANPDSINSITNPALRYPASRYGLNQIEEKGAAVWISDPDLDPSKMLVLHRTAPIGAIIKITNPMTNRTTFAKVVGKFTENESTKDVLIVMTKAVADALGALDKRFYCNLTYGGPDNDEEQ